MIRVLVVDDDFMVARLHGTLVEQLPGFTVAGTAHNGAQACTLFRELQPDLVLLDIYLPDVPGLEVLRELRSGYAPADGPDVLVVTAAQDAETVRGAQRGGAVQYIIKPFEPQLLQERLRRYAEQRREMAELSTAQQADVDRLFTGPPAGATGTPAGTTRQQSFPKGLTEQTATLVRTALDACQDNSGLSASECAEQSGLSRVSARRYLEHFVASGTARVTLRYGTTGRPERRYHPEAAAPTTPENPAADTTERRS